MIRLKLKLERRGGEVRFLHDGRVIAHDLPTSALPEGEILGFCINQNGSFVVYKVRPSDEIVRPLVDADERCDVEEVINKLHELDKQGYALDWDLRPIELRAAIATRGIEYARFMLEIWLQWPTGASFDEMWPAVEVVMKYLPSSVALTMVRAAKAAARSNAFEDMLGGLQK